MNSENKIKDMDRVMEPEKEETTKITELDIDIWNLELRTNDVCMDEYTVREKMQNLRYLKELNRRRNKSFEARLEACSLREMLCEEKERLFQRIEADISGKQSVIEARAAMNFEREMKNSEREKLNNEREDIYS